MRVKREDLHTVLSVASVGLTPTETLEQSNCFVFTEDGKLITFNTSVFTKCKNPLEGVVGAVPAQDLLALLAKFPDDEVDVRVDGGELRVKGGSRREAGITLSAGIRLPYSEVPDAGDWREVSAEFHQAMFQAARVCGRDDSLLFTTCVHVGPKVVEACDNYRFFRHTVESGLADALVPASAVAAVADVPFDKACVSDGWLHLRTRSKHRVSLRLASGKYPNIDNVLKLEDPVKVKLPKDLGEILARAEVMVSTDSLVRLKIERGSVSLEAKKDTGWFRETKEADYVGDKIAFEVNLKFLQDMLRETRRVTIGKGRLQIESAGAVFSVCLEAPDKEKD